MMRQGETVILAAGEFPRKNSEAGRLLAAASRVICCDSAADAYRRRLRKEPALVIGDCDSVRGHFTSLVKISEQETNDLEKAIRYCLQKGWRNPVLLGVTGKREDHTLGNVFRALAFGLPVVTNEGRFIPVRKRAILTVRTGTPISVFATDPRTRMTSRGLVWPLDGVKFENLYCATLNRASSARVVLTTTRPVFVYLAS